ncbi:alpha-glucosidase [Luteibacter sp. W1I16]|uniref:alpha-amylase family glycosyl hydrolase n=1 Tax=Luteibacter sp. W1I16 TaxID=3373922 RepID=UPI003D1CEED6
MKERLWWRDGVVYQVYPRSFADANGDGIGDLEGIRGKLDYLVSLGVDALWISPIYPSPMADFGYDVSDYRGIDPLFGDVEVLDALLADAHARGLKVILDFVPNHSSDEHPWFRESRRSCDSAFRDWYIWRDPAPDGGPPNNWLSNFGGSAWAFDEHTGQYYLHLFLDKQPDLNWRNPMLREAMYDAMRFWLRRGVDGFRVDVIYHVMKDAEFRDNPPNPDYREGIDSEAQRLLPLHTADLPETQGIVAAMRSVVDEFPERVLIGELYLPLERIVAYYGEGLEGANLPFNFLLIGAPWEARFVAGLVERYEAALPEGGWPNWVLGNHDKPRIASRVGDAQARVAAVLLLTLRGTPTMYYGDEIGMHDVPIPFDEVRDPFERNEPGKGLGRDPQRTPMRWFPREGAGFTRGVPWLRLGDCVASRNVATQSDDPASLLSLYRMLLRLRRGSSALSRGAIRVLGVSDEAFAYERRDGDDRFVVVLNFTDAPAALPVAEPAGACVLSTHDGGASGELRANEARIYRGSL